jgi:hypothetical protein
MTTKNEDECNDGLGPIECVPSTPAAIGGWNYSPKVMHFRDALSTRALVDRPST